MIKFNKCILHFLALLFFSCNNRDSVPIQDDSIISKGRYNNIGYEVGWWQYFYKPDNRMLEEGNFVNGVRTGKWKYYDPHKDSIVWRSFNNMSGTIRTNIPDFLRLTEETENLIKFTNYDSNYLFNLVIGKGYTDSANLELYKKMIYEDLSSRNITISDSATNYIETSQGYRYLFSFIFGISEESQRFSLFNIAGSNNEQLIEVTLRCEPKYTDKARKVFFSVIPNLFVDSVRFINSKDIITTFEKNIK